MDVGIPPLRASAAASGACALPGFISTAVPSAAASEMTGLVLATLGADKYDGASVEVSLPGPGRAEAGGLEAAAGALGGSATTL
mmetsp:Transcript_33979/g.63456  ORF Transcript_33979/g.63456 Transcript_33979/m.63456 type:complete len:84 (+) Transcript_33979:581-832(+)